jgi:hypothetical protein
VSCYSHNIARVWSSRFFLQEVLYRTVDIPFFWVCAEKKVNSADMERVDVGKLDGLTQQERNLTTSLDTERRQYEMLQREWEQLQAKLKAKVRKNL